MDPWGMYRMMQKNARADRQVSTFPPPQVPESSPYQQGDFSPEVEIFRRSGRGLGRSALRICKVLLLGDCATGKTALVHRFCHNKFSVNYKPTLGVDFQMERFDVMSMPFNVHMWDTSGKNLHRQKASFYHTAQVVVLVYDSTDSRTLRHTVSWYHVAIEDNLGHRPMIFLVGTKSDALQVSKVYQDALRNGSEVADHLGAELWLVSNKTGDGVADFFFRLAGLAFQDSLMAELRGDTYSIVTNESDDDIVVLRGEEEGKKGKRCSGCAA